MNASDFYLLPPQEQLPCFLSFLRNGKNKDKSPFPCKVTLRGKGTVPLGSSKNTITGAQIKGEFIVISLKSPAWGQQRYEVFFYNGKPYCRIPDAQGRGIDPEFTLEL
ncbi:hypothetical protein A3K29_00290 [Candidatus Collierbacteria bacterium RIFOXYB2_FULL_46_14]|nr:MAG: hypothetical protein A3K29_00290 [Candidatus Collierbacteria bacterium RIFOXYB2_FULL_46_14]OGD75619.1 MAG: hypothetical protein A3K43_00290 [Candidatus Collierbacteria bacterium RIFOXYA2_FULL_46_20]OGD76955.1 MAG: hypothetical protein A3K39_00290 [Candidatus Collierbacteria bacterium RIFOXYC2_FULL_43_15]OGD80246.1 MAG: hypothetical protein A2320_00780 [Pseudomonadales bacterium GWC2_63_15]OGD81677.1 MAG: hypothetical protein A3K36_00290 [Candidatus Collierbacteria bacterium RIFOXYD2_FUL